MFVEGRILFYKLGNSAVPIPVIADATGVLDNGIAIF
jgi:hypothetical protein